MIACIKICRYRGAVANAANLSIDKVSVLMPSISSAAAAVQLPTQLEFTGTSSLDAATDFLALAQADPQQLLSSDLDLLTTYGEASIQVLQSHA